MFITEIDSEAVKITKTIMAGLVLIALVLAPALMCWAIRNHDTRGED